jgi:hypothetical protein
LISFFLRGTMQSYPTRAASSYTQLNAITPSETPCHINGSANPDGSHYVNLPNTQKTAAIMNGASNITPSTPRAGLSSSNLILPSASAAAHVAADIAGHQAGHKLAHPLAEKLTARGMGHAATHVTTGLLKSSIGPVGIGIVEAGLKMKDGKLTGEEALNITAKTGKAASIGYAVEVGCLLTAGVVVTGATIANPITLLASVSNIPKIVKGCSALGLAAGVGAGMYLAKSAHPTPEAKTQSAPPVTAPTPATTSGAPMAQVPAIKRNHSLKFG